MQAVVQMSASRGSTRVPQTQHTRPDLVALSRVTLRAAGNSPASIFLILEVPGLYTFTQQYSSTAEQQQRVFAGFAATQLLLYNVLRRVEVEQCTLQVLLSHSSPPEQSTR